MDGKELVYRLRNILNEDSSSPFLDTKTAYTYLYEAATELVERTSCMKADETVTTVADQYVYDLSADFLKPYWKDRDNRYFLKYSDGSNTHILYHKDYSLIRFDDQSTSVSIPSNFSIIDEAALDTQITGTATGNGAATGGESTLADTAGDFTNASAGDSIHNTTDGSSGVITQVVSTTSVKTCLFGGTNNDWTTNDAYIIVPQARMALILDPPPSTSGHTITIGKIQRPAPVYGEYGAYRIPQRFLTALVHYAAWLFKYRDAEPDTGDRWYQYFDQKIKTSGFQLNEAMNRKGFRVNLNVSRGRSNSA